MVAIVIMGVVVTTVLASFNMVFSSADTLEGTATDAEDGALTGAALRWSSSIAGALGTGSPLTVPGLAAGSHDLQLTARDSSGAESAARDTVLSSSRMFPGHGYD